MAFLLKIDLENVAFDEDPSFETARILEVVATQVAEGRPFGSCIDLNGNTVGSWSLD